MQTIETSRRKTAGLIVCALGVVFGDIGTSPLYALRECFHGAHGLTPTAPHVLGVLSLIIWTLILIVCLKYMSFVLRADNHGEGGILALFALTRADEASQGKRRTVLVMIALLGASLLYGDGMITPCITVLGAVEGLNVATPFFEPWIVPLTLGILIAIFAFQYKGTGKVGSVFGPVMLIWFAALALLGLRGIIMAPEVLAALSPLYGVDFLLHSGRIGFVVMGAVFLAVTGAEALYADLGHFGPRPIRLGWFFIAFPALALNYFGQGALILKQPEALANPFYMLAPDWALYPLVALATAASIIASQALISGAFSLTMQAIQMGYLPRMEIRHTSSEQRGQIYIPTINSFLLVCCLALVLGFRSSSNLASAYGVAVTLTMIATTVLLFIVARKRWGWHILGVGSLCAGLLIVEVVFFAANALKIWRGGWLPLVVAAGFLAVMTTWRTGRRLLGRHMKEGLLPLETFLDDLSLGHAVRVPGTAVYMYGNLLGTPLALLHNFKLNRSVHERVILLTILAVEEPYVDPATRVQVETLTSGFHRVIARYGFMEKATIGEILSACHALGLDLSPKSCTFVLSRETLVRTSAKGMAMWRKRLFVLMSRNAQSATAFFGLPANRVVEMGMQIEF
ncbi:MAG: potassium transporter Kup [Kiritimatiellales bacterium]